MSPVAVPMGSGPRPSERVTRRPRRESDLDVENLHAARCLVRVPRAECGGLTACAQGVTNGDP